VIKSSHAAVAVAVALASGIAMAAPQQDTESVLRQTQQAPAAAQRPQPALPAIQGMPPLEPPMAAAPESPTVAVRAFAIEGNHVMDTVTLLALVSDAAGRSYTVAGLNGVADRITRFYRAKGYFVARAYIPAQEVTGGTVKIRVVEGRYDRFLVRNGSLASDRVVQGILDRARREPAVSADSIERPLLILDDTPGVHVVRADVMPGSQWGTSDFAVETVATPRADGYVSLDNYGSRYTGADRLSFNLGLNELAGIGDRLSMSGLATNHGDLLNGHVDYSTLLAASGLRGDVAAFDTTYQLGGAFSSLNATGEAKGADLGLSYPLRRTQAQTIGASVTGTYESLHDDVEQSSTRTPRTLASMTAGVSLDDMSPLLGFPGETQGNVSVEVGDVRITDAQARALDAAGARTEGGFSKLIADLSRINQLPESLTLTTSLQWQRTLSEKSLDSSEQMAVSGWTGVMAYPPEEAIGDNALVLRGTLSHPLLSIASLRSTGSVFSDYGQASDVHPLVDAPTRQLSDVGVGLTLRYLGATVVATVAHRLHGGDPRSEPYSRNKLLLQGVWAF
jgi:hemolysin activation/secretion protein